LLDKHVQKLVKLDDSGLHEAVIELIVEQCLPVESPSFRKVLELALLRGQTRGAPYHLRLNNYSRRIIGVAVFSGANNRNNYSGQ